MISTSKPQRILICIACLALLIGWVGYTQYILKPMSQLAQHQKITAMDCMFMASPQQGVDQDLQWSPCTLPYNWNTSHPDQHGDGWYRTQVNASKGSNMALYIASLSMNAEAWVNGRLIGSGGSFTEPVARNWNTPLFFSVPPSILVEGSNTLLIHVKGYANSSAGLGHVFWGEKDEMHSVFWQHTLIYQGMNYGIFTIACLLGILFFVLYCILHHTSHLYFSLASLISCIYISDTFLLYIPFSQHVWETMVHCSILISQYFFSLFILNTLKFKGRHIFWFRRFTLLHLLISVIVLLCSSNIHLFSYSLPAHTIGLVWLFYLSGFLWYKWFKTGNMVVFAFAFAVFFEGSVFICDWAPWVFGQGATPPYIFTIGPMVFSLIASLMLIMRFIATYKQEHVFRLELKASLQRQKTKLQEKHLSLTLLEKKQAVQQEQNRITRELHDGMGAHLMGAKTLLKSDPKQANQLINESLDELRTLMDSLDSDADLLSKLGMMRHRLEDRLNGQGIYFDWQVWHAPENMPENPQTMHHIIRIVQESIHNIEKHAHASNIKVFIDLSGIVIQDNGSGFDVTHQNHSRGLKNIHWRAEQAQAVLNITSNQHGTTTHLYWQP